MDDLQFYILFNSISVKSGWLCVCVYVCVCVCVCVGGGVMHTEKLCAKESHVQLGFLAGTEPGPLDQQASA